MKAAGAKLLMKRYLLEGGAVGHLMHLYDNRDLTFAELKDVIRGAAEGRLEQVTEKLDGLNIVFTFRPGEGLKVARSGSDIKQGGMDAASLATKFEGRGNLTDAFNGAFRVLSDAIASLPDDARDRVFEGGDAWYSAEVIYSKNPNVINYDASWIVFHASPSFLLAGTGEVEKRDNAPGVAILERYVDHMQRALTLRSWRVRGPAVLRLQKLADGNVAKQALSAIERAQRDAQVKDSDTVGDYLRNRITEDVADLELPQAVGRATVERCLGTSGAPKLTDIKKMVSADVYPKVNAFVKASPALLKRAIEPIERAVHVFAVELLRGLQSVLVSDHDAEIARLRQQVSAAVKAIEASGNAQAMDVLAKQMQKLGSIENVASAMEGIVFVYKGKTYKFTGAFAPANQILGLFRFGRAGTKLEQRELEDALDQLRGKSSYLHLSAKEVL